MKPNPWSFNTALARSLVRRYPLWVAYFGFLLMSFVLPLVSRSGQIHQLEPVRRAASLNRFLLQNAEFQAQAGVVVAILLVMLFFGHLYQSRASTLVNSLPIRRESVFLTLYLSGLVPLLLCQVTAVLLSAFLMRESQIETRNYLIWLACSALGLITFYGIAVFCAMLTGNLVILPMVYAVLNLAAAGFELCVRSCMQSVVFGLSYNELRFEWLSPVLQIEDSLQIQENIAGEISLRGLSVPAIYAFAGLVLSGLALLLYRRRQMECVSDFVAIPVLRPIFRYCMGVGTAVVLAAAVFDSFFNETVFGVKAACLIGGLMILGAIFGWLIAEMLIRRSFRIVPLPWKGLVLICTVCVLAMFAAETDVIGYERRVPDPELVEGVELCFDTSLKEADNIRGVTQLHQEIIRNKSRFDGNHRVEVFGDYDYVTYFQTAASERDRIYSFDMPLFYHLKNGSVLQRHYILSFRADEVDDPDSILGCVIGLLNTKEGIQNRMTPKLPVEEQYVAYAVISRETPEGDRVQHRLTPQEAVDLWNHAMLPDAAEQKLSLYTIVDTEKNLSFQTNLWIEIVLDGGENKAIPENWSHSYRVFTFSDNCLDWIAEHTDLEWETMTELNREREQRNIALLSQ